MKIFIYRKNTYLILKAPIKTNIKESYRKL